MVAAGAILGLAACGGQELTADETEAKLFEYPSAGSIECRDGDSGWNYWCDVDFGEWGTVLGVDVDDSRITNQTAP